MYHIKLDRDFKVFLDEHIKSYSDNEKTIEEIEEKASKKTESIRQIGDFLEENRKELLRDPNFYKNELLNKYLKFNVVTITLNINDAVLGIANGQVDVLLNSDTGIICKKLSKTSIVMAIDLR
jgi:hypothetical protein